MRRLQLKNNTAQFVIDLLFGVVLLIPLVWGLITGSTYTAVLVTIGAGAGYTLHMVQKILLYEELLSEQVKTHVQDRVDEEVPERAEAEVKEHAEREVERQVNG